MEFNNNFSRYTKAKVNLTGIVLTAYSQRYKKQYLFKKYRTGREIMIYLLLMQGSTSTKIEYGRLVKVKGLILSPAMRNARA